MASERDANILAAHGNFVSRLQGMRQAVVRNCYENARNYLGYQWEKYDGSVRGFRRLNLKPGTPQPVTNKIFALVNSIHAGLCRVEPMLAFRPGSDADEDRLTADLASDVLSYLDRTTYAADLNLRLSKAICLYANAYTVTGYDAGGGPETWVADWVCPAHPERAIPADQAQQLGGQCPEDGQPLQPSDTRGQSVPQGTVYTELATPFELWVDPTITLMRDQPKAMLRRMRTVEWVHARWPEHGDALGTDGAPHDAGMTYLQSLLRSVSGAGTLGYTASTRFTNAVLIDDFHVLPDKEFPNGALARIGNGMVVLDVVDYPYHHGTQEKRGRPFLPIAHYFADDCVPAHYATGPIDHLKRPQWRRNRLQARMEIHEARMANGVWFIPEGMDVLTPSGESGEVIRGNTLASGGAIPRRIDGARIPSTTIMQIPQIDQEMNEIAGMYEIGSGDRPKNVEGGYAMQILQNASKGRQAPLYRRWEQSHAESARHKFQVFRLFAPDAVYYQIKGEESRWRVKQIKAADLTGGVDIDVEPGTGLPQSLLEKRAGVEQALASGLVDIANPIERLRCLRAMGVMDLMAGRNAEDDHLAWEHNQVVQYAKQFFDEQGQLRVPVEQLPPFPVLIDRELDPHDFHLDRHHTWMVSDEYKALPIDVQQMFRMGHALQHWQVIQENRAREAEQHAPPRKTSGPTAAAQSEGAASASEQGRGHTGREMRRSAAREASAG